MVALNHVPLAKTCSPHSTLRFLASAEGVAHLNLTVGALIWKSPTSGLPLRTPQNGLGLQRRGPHLSVDDTTLSVYAPSEGHLILEGSIRDCLLVTILEGSAPQT